MKRMHLITLQHCTVQPSEESGHTVTFWLQQLAQFTVESGVESQEHSAEMPKHPDAAHDIGEP